VGQPQVPKKRKKSGAKFWRRLLLSVCRCFSPLLVFLRSMRETSHWTTTVSCVLFVHLWGRTFQGHTVRSREKEEEVEKKRERERERERASPHL
jgi:hypothetical protein